MPVTGHLGTLDYIYQTLSQYSDFYELSNQTFSAVSGRVFESSLILDDKVSHSAQPMGLSPPTADNEPVLHAKLVLVANEGCKLADYPAAVDGNVALVR